jgi:pimeloyl-ACP methyl ester carboxylesterase
MPSTVETAAHISCPTLFIRGDQEIPAAYPAEDYAAKAGGPVDVEIVENCDHYYKGREDEIIKLVVAWLRDQFPT